MGQACEYPDAHSHFDFAFRLIQAHGYALRNKISRACCKHMRRADHPLASDAVVGKVNPAQLGKLQKGFGGEPALQGLIGQGQLQQVVVPACPGV